MKKKTGGVSLPAIEGGSPVRGEFLPFSPPSIGREEIDGVTAVLKSGWITRGRKCEEFERALENYTGAKNAVVLSSATAGLFLSLAIAGIGEGDEVITTPYTFAATANVVLHAGATPVFADIEPGTFLISAKEIEKSITPRTKALIPVDFAGDPVDIGELRAVAEEHGLRIIEDAAHAIGAGRKGVKVGNGPGVTVFSFHAVKNLTTGEGGAVLTDDEKLARMFRLYSLHGQTKDALAKLQAGGWRYDIEVPGYKCNMTDIQAAIGIGQLGRLDENVKTRGAIAKAYGEFLSGYEYVRVPGSARGFDHAWHLYPLLVDFTRLRLDRDRFIAALAAENVSSNVHYIPVHMMSYYKKRFDYSPSDFPESLAVFDREVSLPIYPGMGEREVSDVLEACAKLFSYYQT